MDANEKSAIERLENSIHAKNSKLFRDAVAMLKAMPESSRERYVFATTLLSYVRSCNYDIIDEGETAAMLHMFLSDKAKNSSLNI